MYIFCVLLSQLSGSVQYDNRSEHLLGLNLNMRWQRPILKERGETISSRWWLLQNRQNLDISRYCLAKDGRKGTNKQTYKVQVSCHRFAFVWWSSRWCLLRALLNSIMPYAIGGKGIFISRPWFHLTARLLSRERFLTRWCCVSKMLYYYYYYYYYYYCLLLTCQVPLKSIKR